MIIGERFNLGKTVITRGAESVCEEYGINYLSFLIRHATGDFGTVGKLDNAVLSEKERQFGALATDNGLKLNALATERQEGLILSTYEARGSGNQRIWVITMLAGDETYTTILLPEEY